jgi:hypothetical protein
MGIKIAKSTQNKLDRISAFCSGSSYPFPNELNIQRIGKKYLLSIFIKNKKGLYSDTFTTKEIGLAFMESINYIK